eukprot:1875367-Rhodomonas_salina.1
MQTHKPKLREDPWNIRMITRLIIPYLLLQHSKSVLPRKRIHTPHLTLQRSKLIPLAAAGALLCCASRRHARLSSGTPTGRPPLSARARQARASTQGAEEAEEEAAAGLRRA